jgi:thiamine-monophosphate kinase
MLLEGMQSPPEVREKILESVYTPKARLELGLMLADKGFVSSSIDSSDGLAWCLHELSVASKVGFELNRIPVSAEARTFAAAHRLSPEELALYGGEEYELVVTVPPGKLDEVISLADTLGSRIMPIGKVVEGSRGIVLRTNGEERQLPVRGWEHFSG